MPFVLHLPSSSLCHLFAKHLGYVADIDRDGIVNSQCWRCNLKRCLAVARHHWQAIEV